MISAFFKLLVSLLIVSASVYSISEFGFNYAFIGVIALSIIILASIIFEKLNIVARALSLAISALSFLALALLMLAGTIGGSFNLSPSNEVIALFLFFIALFGATSYFWPGKLSKNIG